MKILIFGRLVSLTACLVMGTGPGLELGLGLGLRLGLGLGIGILGSRVGKGCALAVGAMYRIICFVFVLN